MSVLGTIVVYLTGNSASYTRMLEEAAGRTADITKEVEKAAAKIENYGASLIKFARSAVAAIASMKTTEAFSEFDRAMVQATSIMKVTDDQINKMRQTALDLSTEQIKGPTELAKAYYALASAGLSAEQAMSLLPTVSRFAAVAMIDTSKATTLLMGAQAALGLKSDDAAVNTENMARVADVLTRASKVARTPIDKLAISLSNFGGAGARMAGKSLEEAVAFLSVLGSQNIQGYRAGTDLDRSIRLLAKTSLQHRDVQEQMGFKVFEEGTGKMRPLVDILRNLEQVMRPLSPELQQATWAQMGFDARIRNALSPLVGLSGQFDKFLAQLKDARGIMDEVGGKMGQSFSAQMTRLKNTFTVVMIQIGSMVAPTLLAVAEVLRNGLNWWRRLDESTRSFVMTSIGVYTAIMNLRLGLLLLAGAVLIVLNPFRLFVAGLSLLLTQLERTGGLAEMVRTGWEALSAAAAGVWQWLGKVGDLLAPVFDKLLELLAPTVAGVFLVAMAFRELWDNIGPILDAIGGLIGWFMDLISIDEEFITALGGTAIALYAAWQAFNLVSFAIGLVSGLLSFLGIQTMISTMVWLAWNTAVYLVTAGIVLFYAELIVFRGIMYAIQGITVAVIALQTAYTAVLASARVQAFAAGVAYYAYWTAIRAAQAANLIFVTGIYTVMAALWLVGHAAIILGIIVAGVTGSVRLANLVFRAMAISFRVGEGILLGFAAVGRTFATAFAVSYTAAITSGGIANAFWATMSGIATVATMSFTGAVSGATVAMTLFTIAAAAIAGAVIYGAFIFLAGAVLAVYHAGKAVIDVLRLLPTETGPIGAIGRMFSEWADILGDVITLVRGGRMKEAWELLSAYAELAVSQLRDVFPPVWRFLEQGFSALWKLVRTTFQAEIDLALFKAKKPLLALFDGLGLAGKKRKEVEQAMENSTQLRTRLAKATAKLEFDQALKGFQVEESQDTKDARKKVNDLRAELMKEPEAEGSDVFGLGKMFQAAARAAALGGEEVGKQWTGKAIKEVQKFDAALTGSSEAIARYMKFQERLQQGEPAWMTKERQGEKPMFDAARLAIPAMIREGADELGGAAGVDVLQQILEEMREQRKAGGILRIDPAGLKEAT